MRRLFQSIVLLATAHSVTACSTTGSDGPNGEAASGSTWDRGAIVTAAEPYAVEAAIEMIEKGGHAVDAAIAAHAVLGLVEPQSSGLGGSAFLLVFEAGSKDLSYFEGRETAPAGATPDMFMLDGEVRDFIETWSSGISIGVPGTVALYKTAHDAHGRLPWKDVFQPAIRLARDGFKVPLRLANYMPRMAQLSRLDENPGAAEYFYPNGEPLKVGDIRTNPEYADTLTRVANEGISAFYSGELAEAMARVVHQEPLAGSMTTEDIADYHAVEREAVCADFRDVEICSAAPPSSGAAVIMMAGLYDRLATGTTDQPAKVAAFVDAQRLAYADRDQYFGDPGFVSVPLEGSISPEYLDHRAAERFAPDELPTPGDPGGMMHQDAAAPNWGADTTMETIGTSHLSIIDDDGNAVAMSASVGAPFGSTRWVGGFVINNEMADFATEYHAGEGPQANAIAPGKRPRSSMSPTIVLDGSGNVRMVTGSPGGNSIPAYVGKTIVGILDWGLTAQEAVDFPNIVARGAHVRVEISVEPGPAIAEDLASRGYDVQERDGENSGLHVIVVRPGVLDGAADKRREGVVRTTSAH
jgi:gamma-glutamyltranspeptidase/glutathione hydrolase